MLKDAKWVRFPLPDALKVASKDEKVTRGDITRLLLKYMSSSSDGQSA